ncbi:ABC transporter permease [Arenimonas sp. MALMAid1274]|uniref:ABC transporter permease n=1 Tax=Arenimonas sp. MALMAid1274 TaxID=3411630 RepID=UPI003BA07069
MNPSLHPVLAGLGRPSSLRIHALEAWFEFLRVLRTPAFAVPTLTFPLVFYVVFALLVPGQWGSLDKAAYLFATYCAFGVIGPALFGFGVGLAIEREQGWLDLKRVSPMPTSAYFLAKIAMSLAFAMAVVGLLTIAAVGFGGVDISLVTWLKLAATLVLGTLPFCAIGLWIGALVKGQAAVAVVNLVYLPMALLSGLWIPLFVFPAVMQKLAVLWPAWHLGQMTLGIVGQAEGVRYGLHAAVLAVMTLLFLSLAALRLRKA